ncbi:NAD(P)-binding protein [Ideonella alba]|uniref:NAD(P)-binding protein n=1 Tax=Ideonella alba TaxID=2824118 RepID=A0A941BJK6_9BURK|nr:NAD(P)-binding protein [Ideonella alba]MBQ0929194.1 NAD(P)-binding protein [Ideonella alba]
MADPILAMHRHSAGLYELSALRTGSLRDQMLRATAMVERLHATRRIRSDIGGGLLVIGGGAAGLCAAKRASELNVEVHLAEARGRLLGPQRGVSTRLIDPVEYDWPHRHWDQAGFPAGFGRPLPLRFAADTAAKLAVAWGVEFNRAVQASRVASRSTPALGQIHLHMGHRVEASDVQDLSGTASTPVSNVQWLRRSGAPLLFGAALSCVGFGDEDVKAGHFRGRPFWSADDMSLWPAKAKILVSGGGDGAMQDLQRAATGLFGRALFEALDLPSLLEQLPESRELAAVEDAHRRLLAWSAPGTIDPSLLHSWNQAFEQVADAVARQWDQDATRLQQALALIRRPHVTWSMKHPQLGPCYALNRLLALLVVRLLQRHPDRQSHPHFLPGKELLDVHLADGRSGLAHFGDGTTLPVDRVVVRHGIQKTQGVPLFGNAPISTQQVPFALI